MCKIGFDTIRKKKYEQYLKKNEIILQRYKKYNYFSLKEKQMTLFLWNDTEWRLVRTA